MFQMKYVSSVIVLALILLLVSTSLYAKQLTFRILQSDSTVSAFRYRTDGNPWIQVDGGNNVLSLQGFDPDKDILSLQQYSNDVWGPLFSYQFDDSSRQWKLLGQNQIRVLFKMSPTDDSIIAYRYKREGTDAAWQIIDPDQELITLPEFNPDEALEIQESSDMKKWSGSYRYHYDPITESWLAYEKPIVKKDTYSIGFHGLASKTSSQIEHLYISSYGGGIQGSITFPFERNFKALFELQLQWAKSNNLWTDSYIILGTNFGVGYIIPLFTNLALIPSLSYGFLTHQCEDICSGTAQGTWYVDQQLQAMVQLEIPITQTILCYLRSHATLLLEKQRIGLLYGMGGGIQFAW